MASRALPPCAGAGRRRRRAPADLGRRRLSPHAPFTGRRRALLLGLAAAAAGAPAPALAQGTPDPLPLGRLAKSQGLVFGTAVQVQQLESEPAYAALAAREAELLVPEYEGKWATMQPQEGRFDTALLDRLLRWAAQHGKQVRGHALVWHQDLPDWTRSALAESPTRARVVLEAHIHRVLDHTRAKIRDWDVVNEVVATPAGSRFHEVTAQQDGYRETPWLRALGPRYIGLALQAARAADPTLRLTLNDYGIEGDTPAAEEKRQRLLRLVRALRDQRVPLDAVGMQGHLQMAEPFSAAPLTAFIRALRGLGLDVLVTELDVREAQPVQGDYAARDEAVADRVHAFCSTCIEAGVRSLLTWGLSDRWSWLARDKGVALPPGDIHRGLPFDWELRRKAMWQAMARAMQKK
jgi:endo-1,4-beta-xylanase